MSLLRTRVPRRTTAATGGGRYFFNGLISRMLKDADEKSIERLRRLLRRLVVGRLRKLSLPRVTLDFDGSVQSTMRRAEGTAVGVQQKEERRSQLLLLCHT